MTRSRSNDLADCIQALQDIMAAPDRAEQIAEAALAKIVRDRMGLVALPEGRIAVRIPEVEHGWAKWVLDIDLTGRGGYMFDGPFIPTGKPAALPRGAVVIVASGGTKKQPTQNVLVGYVVQDDGALGYPVHAVRASWPELAVRIADYLKAKRTAPLITEPKL